MREQNNRRYDTDPEYREKVLRKTHYEQAGLKYQAKLLRQRRYRALKRMAKRRSDKEAATHGAL